jgi:cellulose synthase/poly-beta-1,6-N-acetylglucosamine synthase-like glycosyltransferase
MIYSLYVLASLLILQGIVSLLEGFRYFAYVRRSLAAPLAEFTPKISLIAPCKGFESRLEENLRALFQQDYPQYEIIFVVAAKDDAALPVISQVIAEQESLSASQHTDANAIQQPQVSARIIFAGHQDGRSEKVNNLLCAIEAVDETCEAYAFVDSDALVAKDWLRSLVAPLADEQIGATTGFRWYLPEKGGFFAALLSAWNGSVATTLGDHKRNFVWGGSTAILRKTFEQLQVRDAWAKALSDDYALTKVLQKSGQLIRFVPRCMTISKERATLASLLEFTTRQVIITRVYNARLWWIGLLSQIFFNVVFFGGLVFASVNLAIGKATFALLAMLILIYLLGSAKGVVRFLVARKMLPQAKRDITKLWWMYCLLWVLVSLLYLFNFMQSATTRRILWRGVWYEMRSPAETIVIR